MTIHMYEITNGAVSGSTCRHIIDLFIWMPPRSFFFPFSFHQVCSMYFFFIWEWNLFSFLFTFCFMDWIEVTDYFFQKINGTFEVQRWPPFWQEWLGTCAENKSPELLSLECPSSHSLTRAVAFESTDDRCSATFSVSGWVMPTAKAF